MCGVSIFVSIFVVWGCLVGEIAGQAGNDDGV